MRVTPELLVAATDFEHVIPVGDSRRSVPHLSITPLAASDLLQPLFPTYGHELRPGDGSYGPSSAESLLTDETHYKPPSSRTDAQHDHFESPLSIPPKTISSMDGAAQTHSALDSPAEREGDPGLASRSERDQWNAMINGLQQVASHRSNAVDIRSGAQEEGRNLINLHSQLASQMVPIFEVVRARLAPVLGEDWHALVQNVNSAEDLFAQISKSMKVFDTAQERVQALEWRLLEKEERLYASYRVGGSPVSTMEDVGEVFSELSSVPLSPEPEYLQSQREAMDNRNVFSPGPESRSRDATRGHSTILEDVPILSPDDSFLFSLDEPVNVPLPASHPDDEATQPESQSLQHSITQRAETQLLHYNPEDTMCEGFQFESNDEEAAQALWPGSLPSRAEIAKNHPPTSTMMGFYQWISYGAPWRLWSSTTGLGYQNRVYLLPVDTRFLRSLMLNVFEATCLELSSAPRVLLLRDKVEDVQATRVALMNNWLWEPTCPVGEIDHSPFARPLFESRQQASSVQASSITENASKHHLAPVPTTPRPRPAHKSSMSTIVQLNWHTAANSPPNHIDPLLSEPNDRLNPTSLLATDVNSTFTGSRPPVTRRISVP